MRNLPNDPGDPRSDAAVEAELPAVLLPPLAECVTAAGAVAGIVYLADPDRSRLRAAVIQGSIPFVFGMPDVMSTDDRYASATAWRTGEVTMGGEPAPEPGDAPFPHVIPFPYSAAAVPLARGGHRYGALTVVRLPEPGEDWALSDARRTHLVAVAERLTTRLAALEARGVPVTPGPNVVLVPTPGTHRDTAGEWGVPGVDGSGGWSLMFQVHKLSARLTRVTGLDEIAPAVVERVMRPFAAQGVIIGQITDGRLWIMGSDGVGSSVIRELHGAAMTAGTPWADAALTLFPKFFPSRAELRRRYPGIFDGGDVAGSWAFLPLSVGNRPVGVCCLSFADERRLDTEEQAALMMLTDLLAPAMERARLGAYEHVLSESLQRTLLPRELTALPGVVTTARYVPARTDAGLGGDWYDVMELPDGRIGLIVGDVEGHSTDSAIVMGQLRSAVLAYVKEGHDPAAVLGRAGRMLADLETELIASCCIAFLNVEDGVLEVARAGHPPPLLRHPDGRLEYLDVVPGVPLGITPASGTNCSSVVPPGATLMLYTDGMHRPSTGDIPAAALDLLASADADLEELADRLVETTADGHDDLVLLLAHYEGGVAGASRRIEQMEIPRHDLRGVADARRFVRKCLEKWDAPQISDALEMITSEAVTNALIHADSDVGVRLREYDDRVRLEVRDSDAHPPLPSAMSVSEEDEQAQAEHGRGLVIVDSLATAWGSSPHGRGKTVWMELKSEKDDGPGPQEDPARNPADAHPADARPADEKPADEKPAGE
ncbi:ATP-binding SpoIIE family protein phosphatase [Actinacidiphila acidipaludis]|uniref:SpoIIE family protein phosphatase n=1 Tax=Actinacidiphila acidipaludis TaxID=2873382 RepID=A0ABS7QE41_9ACTN|nr:SpoIIE family protein phosphatase [Streptomyces acidipaludis]MBY8881086.1 SpoIIE family protein phosphatase [Streptomyces acidipaludis]